MAKQFVYVTYIRTTPEKVWDALTSAEFTRQYWWGMRLESGDWKSDSSWSMTFADGRPNTAGKVLESDKPRRLVLSWNNQYRPDLIGDEPSRAIFEIEQAEGAVKLTVTHVADRDAKIIEAVSGGWPQVLASLKSWLETGEALEQLHKTL